ncbi:glycosyltransferase family 4 protein [Bradyrhizobium sp. JYMT SZCCT0428]|uniref:glycosyltransferase family 4 protein n=1 Tax=Bradyrhizobium sp. JYMT SZCCT0428 TaxID=2807673 RepID=UPI001BAB1B34|nr:glycosyltransferase family 4 protein [Bradyrhizobium sp. JYMT SZCCT0428]MBR1153689.1 glycosyltransferase family 4 protein [Bradyrhizobium sp. JYMT SZCCT0428]
MGRQAAGAAFLKALAHQRPTRLFCYTAKREFVDQFSTDIRRYGSDSTAIEWLPLPAHRRLGEAGLLYVPDPGLAPFAWRRARHAPRSYSLCGVTHTLMSHDAMELLASMALSPLEHWDAVICTSRAVRQSVDHLLAVQADFFKRRFGARRMPIPQLPIIPLGVDCGNFAFKDGERQKARQMLGIDDDEIVLLYVGRLSFHAKAHHVPMLVAAEQASKGHKVVLLQAGWFAHEKIEAIYRTEGAQFAPSLRRIFVDGRKAKDLRAAWAAGDIFTSLTDNFQETFGLTPVEAMASGIPVVVSDWNGYKDSVRDGVDGFRIPTITLPPGSAEFLVERADFGFDNYDTYCGLTSQLIAVDVKAATDAYRKLFSDPNLRRQMGDSGKKRAREDYDWSKIMGLYGQLWAELGARRKNGAEGSVPSGAVRPDRMNPFTMFSSYPTKALEGKMKFTLVEGTGAADADRRLSAESFSPAANILIKRESVGEVVQCLEKEGTSLSLLELSDRLPQIPRDMLARILIILTKCGILTFVSTTVVGSPKPVPASA